MQSLPPDRGLCAGIPSSGDIEAGDPIPSYRQRAWMEIDRAALLANTRALRRFLQPRTRLLAVIKADGYGHGALTVASAALEAGAAELGVATLAEAIELRQAGIAAPLLVLGSLSLPEELAACQRWELMPTISDREQVRLCAALGRQGGQPLNLHLKLDTGMTRLGAHWADGLQLLRLIEQSEGVRLRGLYSHLAVADDPHGHFTRQQQERFEAVLQAARQEGLNLGLCHLANSAGTLGDRLLHYDMVRVGLALYGHAPAAHLADVLPLRPAMAVRARVTLLRQVQAGTGVSYGSSFHVQRPSRLAVVGIGYADGVPRLLSNRMAVLFRGQRLPQVGAITMDQLMVDATDAPALSIGDVVTLLGSDGVATITPEAWSQACRTIPWEILCGFKHRLPRLVEN